MKDMTHRRGTTQVCTLSFEVVALVCSYLQRCSEHETTKTLKGSQIMKNTASLDFSIIPGLYTELVSVCVCVR